VVFIRDSANAAIGIGVAIGVAIEAMEVIGLYNFKISKITLVIDINSIIKNIMQINAI
jgi:hypothetical protein